MTKVVTRKKAKAIEQSQTQARSLFEELPLDVIYVIMETLKSHRDAICASSLTGRSFRSVAQSFLGRHISVTDHGRVKECIRILNDSGFQHVRSLSLGITDKKVILEEYWNDYLEVLKVFAQRRSLVQLWLWEVPFFFLQRGQKKAFKEIVLGLSASVHDLGLYGCHFSCYEEMVSFVRAFPRCNKLYIQDCVTGGQASPKNSFKGFPQHKLSIVDLDLTASSKSELLIDLSGFIEDAELDVSSLSGLACDLRLAEGVTRVVFATSESPIRVLRFSSTCSDGFQGFMTSMPARWDLKSLTIGPMYHKADTAFWQAALKNFPKLPHLTKVQIIYHYRTYDAFNTSCWSCFSSLLSNRGAFPRLEVVDVCPTLRSQRLGYHKLSPLLDVLKPLESGPTLTFWGKTTWYSRY